MIHKLRALIRNYGDPNRGAHNGYSTSFRELDTRYYKIMVKWTLTLKA